MFQPSPRARFLGSDILPGRIRRVRIVVVSDARELQYNGYHFFVVFSRISSQCFDNFTSTERLPDQTLYREQGGGHRPEPFRHATGVFGRV